MRVPAKDKALLARLVLPEPRMPRYFFHVHDGEQFTDLQGTELTDLDEARRAAGRATRPVLGRRRLDDAGGGRTRSDGVRAAFHGNQRACHAGQPGLAGSTFGTFGAATRRTIALKRSGATCL